MVKNEYINQDLEGGTIKKNSMKAVVFDMDGVIFDSERLVLSCWKKIADKYGIKDVEKVCKKCLGTNAKASMEIFKQYYGNDFPYEQYKKESSALYHKTVKKEGLALKPGVREILDYLTKEEYKIGLASSTRRQVVEEQLKQADIIHYFEQIICGDMVSKSKPEPDIYLLACNRLQVEPTYAYAIEDSYNGIRAAYSAGMHPVMVPDLAEPIEEMEEKAVFIGNSLLDFIMYLKKKS